MKNVATSAYLDMSDVKVEMDNAWKSATAALPFTSLAALQAITHTTTKTTLLVKEKPYTAMTGAVMMTKQDAKINVFQMQSVSPMDTEVRTQE